MIRKIFLKVMTGLGLKHRHTKVAAMGEHPAAKHTPVHFKPHPESARDEESKPRHPRGGGHPSKRDSGEAHERRGGRPEREEHRHRRDESGRAPRREERGGRGRDRDRKPRERVDQKGHSPGRPAEAAAIAELEQAHAAWDPASYQVAPAEGKVRFPDLALDPRLLHAVADLGFQYCTPIQGQALPHSLDGKDVAGKAQTGTGKTAAFMLAVFHRFLQSRRQLVPGKPRALVIAPTRELVIQIQKDAAALGKYTGFRCLAVYGGLGLDEQRRELEHGVDLVAATPGRLLDFATRGSLDLSQVEVLVIDEADRMLDMGFIPDVRRIVARLPHKEKRQTMLFSATLSGDIMRLASQWMVNPVTVEVEPEHVAASTIKQEVYLLSSHEKPTVLLNLIRTLKSDRILVFANRRDVTERVAERLERAGIDCGLLSGDVPQNKRIRIIEGFRSGQIPVVVATDVAGRGLHIDKISHVINYDVPVEPEDYVHRIGRTGRAGAAGHAITFACEKESFTLPEIEELIGQPLAYVQPDPELLRAPHHHHAPRRQADDDAPATDTVSEQPPRNGTDRAAAMEGVSGERTEEAPAQPPPEPPQAP